MRFLIIALVILGLFALAHFETENRRQQCEVDIAKQFHSEAVYQRGECIVKGWGKVRI